MIITTGPSVEGRQVSNYLGIVSAQAIMGVHIGKDIKALGRNIVGGRSAAYEKEVATAVADVTAELEAAAVALGADAVVSVDLDYETVNNNMLMVAASGTAVQLA